MTYMVYTSSKERGAKHLGDKKSLEEAKKVGNKAKIDVGTVIIIEDNDNVSDRIPRNIWQRTNEDWKQICTLGGK